MRNALLFVCLLFSFLHGSLVAVFAMEEPWYRIENGRPIYTRSYRTGLDPAYGKPGQHGLVWYAAFDGNLTSQGMNPEDPGQLLTVEGTVEGAADHLEYIPGLRGQALMVKANTAGETGAQGVTFHGLDKITASSRGTLVVWMYTKDGSFTDEHNNFFETGCMNLLVWTHWEMVISGRGWSQKVYGPVQLASNDFKGWNMYAFTWVDGDVRVYANGMPFHQGKGHPIPGLPYVRLHLNGPTMKSRAFDEVAVYNRPLTVGELRQQYLAMLKPETDQRLLVPRVKNAVHINGNIDEAEWAGASEVTGLLESAPTGETGSAQLSDPQNSFLVQYDEKNLYVAIRSPWPEAILQSRQLTTGLTGALKTAAHARDQVDPSKEDAFTLLVSPLDKGGTPGKVYTVIVNSRNQITDGVYASSAKPLPALDTSWDVNAQIATREDEQGGIWVCEAAIPWEDMGIAPGAGQSVGFNVARSWKLLKSGMDAWASGTRPITIFPVSYTSTPFRPIFDLDEQIPLGIITFGAEAPVIRVRKLGDLLKGRLDFQAVISNPTAQPISLQVQLLTNTSLVLQNQTITLEAGREFAFTSTGQLESYSDTALIFEVRNAQKQLIARNEWTCVRPQSFDAFLQPFPSVGKLVANLDCAFLAGVEPNTLHAVIIITDATGKTVHTVKSDPFVSYRKAVEISTADLLVGQYQLDIKVFAADTLIAEEKDIPYVKQPLPSWLGNRYGYNFTTVPAPFTPVKRESTSVSVWERKYDFGNKILPMQITTLGMPVLRAPVRLSLTLSDGRIIHSDMLKGTLSWNPEPSIIVRSWDNTGLPRNVRQRVSPDIRAEGLAVVRDGDVQLQNRFWVEFDGLIWSELQISGPKNLNVVKAVLEVPYTAAFSDVIHPTLGRIPANGTISEPRITWIGNGYGGVQVGIQSNLWGVADIGKAQHIIMTPDGATLQLTLLDTAMPLDQLPPATVSLQATPVKARYPNYRRMIWYLDGSNTYFDIAGWYPPGQEFVPCPDNFYTPSRLIRPFKTNLSVPKEQWPANWKDGPLSYGAVYVTATGMNISTPEGQDFKEEWLIHASPDDRTIPGDTIIRTSTCPQSYRDYYLWRHGRLMEQMPYASLYYDCLDNGGPEDNNPYLAGTPGFLQRNLAARELAQRLYTLVKDKFPDGIMFDHTVWNNTMFSKSFTDFQLEGEQLWPLYKPGMRNVKGIVTMDTYRAHYMGLNFGRIGCWDPKLGNQPHTMRSTQRKLGPCISQHMQSIVMLHDSSFGIETYAFPTEHLEPLKNALIRYNWGSQYLTIPYWDQAIVTLSKPAEAKEPWQGLYATFYVEPAGGVKTKPVDSTGYYIREMNGPANRVICIFSNETDWTGEMRVKLDWKKLGLSPNRITAENAVHRYKVRYTDPNAVDSNEVTLPEGSLVYEDDPTEFARIEGDTLIFPITAWNYRMIVLTPKLR
jgi:hypothetical protein